MRKTQAREQKRRLKLRAVIDQATAQLNSKEGLQKAEQVRAKVMEEHKIAVSREYVCQVLRHDIGAKFKKIRKVPYLGNTSRCLLL